MVHAGDTHRGRGMDTSCRSRPAAALGLVGDASLEAPSSCVLSVIREAAGGEVSRLLPVCRGSAHPTGGGDPVGDIVKGFSNVEITQRRSLSTNSVKSYIRSAYRKIGGQTFTVTQAGAPCTFTIAPTSSNLTTSAATTGTVTVTAGTGCSWTAVSNATSWMTVTAGANGSGNGSGELQRRRQHRHDVAQRHDDDRRARPSP